MPARPIFWRRAQQLSAAHIEVTAIGREPYSREGFSGYGWPRVEG